MKQKHFSYVLVLTWVLSASCSPKKIIFREVQCQLKGNKVQKIECFMEQSNSFTIRLKTNDIKINNLVGISDLTLNIYGKRDGMRFKGIRLDLCKLNASKQPSILSIMQNGLSNSENNLPKNCNFQRNTTYYVRNVKFDVNYLPLFMPEYNFTYIGKFHVNYVKTYDMRITGSLLYDNSDANYTKI